MKLQPFFGDPRVEDAYDFPPQGSETSGCGRPGAGESTYQNMQGKKSQPSTSITGGGLQSLIGRDAELIFRESDATQAGEGGASPDIRFWEKKKGGVNWILERDGPNRNKEGKTLEKKRKNCEATVGHVCTNSTSKKAGGGGRGAGEEFWGVPTTRWRPFQNRV